MKKKNICNNFEWCFKSWISTWLQGTGKMKLNATEPQYWKRVKYFMAREGSDQPLHKTADPGA